MELFTKAMDGLNSVVWCMGPVRLNQSEEMRKYLAENNLSEKTERAAHIVWATGGSLVPEEIREEYKRIRPVLCIAPDSVQI